MTKALASFSQEAGNIVAHKMIDVQANNVHIAWQIPQYALITAGEVLFSVTGLEFSYSQVGHDTYQLFTELLLYILFILNAPLKNRILF